MSRVELHVFPLSDAIINMIIHKSEIEQIYKFLHNHGFRIDKKYLVDAIFKVMDKKGFFFKNLLAEYGRCIDDRFAKDLEFAFFKKLEETRCKSKLKPVLGK